MKLIKSIIQYKIVFALAYQDEMCLALYHAGKLFCTEWLPADNLKLFVKGLTLEKVWEGFVVQIGGLTIEQGNSLDEQIVIDEQRAKLQKEIDRLEKLARTEKQPKKKFELVRKRQELIKQIKKQF